MIPQTPPLKLSDTPGADGVPIAANHSPGALYIIGVSFCSEGASAGSEYTDFSCNEIQKIVMDTVSYDAEFEKAVSLERAGRFHSCR